MKAREKLVTVGLVLTLVLAGTTVWVGAHTAGQVYHACVNDSTGTIFMVANVSRLAGTI